ncbi:MAG: hypothetical protein AB7P02_17260 [Alphaproteobacteria bacterium]
MQAGAGILANNNRGWGTALGAGVAGGLQGLRQQTRDNDDAYDRKYRRAREAFGDERENYRDDRQEHQTGERFRADATSEANRYAWRGAELENASSRDLAKTELDAEKARDADARARQGLGLQAAGQALQRDRFAWDRARDDRDFQRGILTSDRAFQRQSEQDAEMRARRATEDERATAADRRAQEKHDSERENPSINSGAYGVTMIPREGGILQPDKAIVRPYLSTTGGGSGGGTKVTSAPVKEQDLITLDGQLADALGMATKDTKGFPVPTSAFDKLIPPDVRQAYRRAAADELARTGNTAAAVEAGMAAVGIPLGSKHSGAGWFSNGQLTGPDGKALTLGGAERALQPAPDRTRVVPGAPAGVGSKQLAPAQPLLGGATAAPVGGPAPQPGAASQGQPAPQQSPEQRRPGDTVTTPKGTFMWVVRPDGTAGWSRMAM